MACDDEDRQAGPMKAREDFRPTTQILASLRQEQGRQNSFFPKNERTRQRLLDEELQAKLEWMSQDWRTFFFSRNLLPLHHLHKVGGNTNTNIKTLNGLDIKTPNGEITSGKITIGEIINGEFAVFFSNVSRTDISECRARDGV